MKMRLINLRMPESYFEKLEQLVEAKHYPNRSEAIRYAIRDFIIKEFDRIREEDLNNPKKVRVTEIHDPDDKKIIHILEKLT